MDDLEQLVRDQLQHAEQRPPDGLWEAIENGLPKAPTAAKSTGRGLARRWKVSVYSGSVAIVAAAATIIFASTRQHQPTFVASEQHTSEIQTVAADSLVVSEAVAVAATPTQSKPTERIENQIPTPRQVQTEYAETTGAKVQHRAVAAETAEEPSANTQVADAQLEKVSRPVVETSSADEVATVQEPSSGPDTASHSQPTVTIVIPNLLSPNGDGYNDCWVIPGLEVYGTVQVQVYTAKSKRVFSSQDYHNEFCGDDLPDGNYFYVLYFRDLKVSRRGVLVIKR